MQKNRESLKYIEKYMFPMRKRLRLPAGNFMDCFSSLGQPVVSTLCSPRFQTPLGLKSLSLNECKLWEDCFLLHAKLKPQMEEKILSIKQSSSDLEDTLKPLIMISGAIT